MYAVVPGVEAVPVLVPARPERMQKEVYAVPGVGCLYSAFGGLVLRGGDPPPHAVSAYRRPCAALRR